MTKSVKELIEDYKETNELMSLNDFKFCIKEANLHLAMAGQYDDKSKASKIHFKIAFDIAEKVSKHFKDEDNLINWLRGKPCSYYHPITHKKVEVKVRSDYEAIYMFLRYCMKLKQHESIDDDFISYLAYILCEPTEI